MINRQELLQLIERNARISEAELAVMIGSDEKSVAEELCILHEENVILGYAAIINWDKTERESVTALIEIRITPQRNKGFDQIAAQLYRYTQVTSCYLMSGGFDLMVIIEDSTLREVASFIAEKVAPIEGVISTSTHFILKKYKGNGIVFDVKKSDDRETVVL
ncbi:MAG: Lrp/AsnC family transcriptional regulator [Clostridiaceae bacterium]|jgi:DNA-binding Lrp family transcriptional regulator|nr:Lrp/AsnC family transcriptional regulator [Clostridiaceae bacterium]